ncbi:MAG: alpha-glucosidase/alpha-galactosidase [Oscillospiraceae bacterium]|nr:alpha-glucosidase/alpha-galactosidase [Oscillospiraceae bacterium]
MNGDRLNIAYIGGGSCNFGWRLIPELADIELCAMVKLYDTDKTCSLANEVIGNNIHDRANTKGDIVYLACDEAEEALRDADFVILAFEPGELDEQAAQLHLPETYGIFQTGGENSGLSSVIRALKIMPLCAEYSHMIEHLCPEAWVINLCTPMAECMTVLKREFPEMKLLGTSSDTFASRELIATMVCESKGISGVRRRDIKTNLLGISGFSWYDEITYGGEDLMPMFREYAEKYSDSGYEFRINEYKTNPDADAHRVKFDLFLRLGIIPAVNDRSAAEFCPPWYTKDTKEMASWKFSPMTVNYKKRIFSDKTAKVKKYMNGDILPKSVDSTEVPEIIRALCGGGNLISAVSLPNRGQVENLPEGTIVETNALISRGSVRAVCGGRLPESAAGLSVRHAYNREAVVRAYVEKDLDIAFNAFLNDPVMTCGLTEATELYREMLSAVRNHLLYYCE